MLCLHVCLWTTCMQCPWRPEQGVGSPGTEVTNGCEPPCGCWALSWHLLKHSQSPNLGALLSLCSYLLISTKLASVQLSLGLITLLNNLSLLRSNNSKWSFLPPNKSNTAEERKSSLIKTATFLKLWHLEFTSNLAHEASKPIVIYSRWMDFFWVSSAVVLHEAICIAW